MDGRKFYAIYRNRILIYLHQRPNIMSCSTVISKQTWEKSYLKKHGAYYNLPAALQGETALEKMKHEI